MQFRAPGVLNPMKARKKNTKNSHPFSSRENQVRVRIGVVLNEMDTESNSSQQIFLQYPFSALLHYCAGEIPKTKRTNELPWQFHFCA